MSPTMRLRPYQETLLNDIYSQWGAGHQNVLAVLPTGGGKTVVFSEAIRNHSGASVGIAHRQELVSQMSLAYARDGVRHRIIGPSNVIKWVVQLHMQELGRDFYDPSSPCAVAGVDTLISWMKPESPQYNNLRRWADQVTMWVQDECFPAGTRVDGRPIESLLRGDTVTAFNETTGRFESRVVTSTFKNPAPLFAVRLQTICGRELVCTPSHPLWTKRGWVKAGGLTPGDEVLIYDSPVFYVPNPRALDDCEELPAAKNRAGILRQGLLNKVSCAKVLRNRYFDEPKVRLGTDEAKEPDAQGRVQREDAADLETNRACAVGSRGERKALTPSRGRANTDVCPPRVYPASSNKDGATQRKCAEAPPLLQNRLRTHRTEARAGSRRGQPRVAGAPAAGSEKRRISYWSRVDSITIQQFSDSDAARECYPDGFVYNIEVEGLHTYLADGIVAHNCHHLLRANKWGKAIGLFPHAYGLGVTATPERADGKGLGEKADGVFSSMVVGPGMRQLITDGYLTDYRILCPPSDLDLHDVATGADGDYVRGQLAAKTRRSSVMGDVVDHYIKHAAGKLGVTFAPDVETASELAVRFQQAGIAAEVVSAKTPDRVRVEILRRFRARRLQQLVNVDLFGEGFDLPAIEVVSMARATKSYSLFAQQFGRSLRIMEGKDRALILDHVGNVIRFNGPPDRPRAWSLMGKERRGNGPAPDLIPLRNCLNPTCMAPFERVYPACPLCGWTPVPSGRSAPEQVDGDLIELDPETLAAMRGEVAKMQRHPDAVKRGLLMSGQPEYIAAAAAKRHGERLAAHGALADNIAAWAGVMRDLGFPDRESYRRFYYRFGVDVLTAQTLPRAEAEALNVRLGAALGRVV